MRLNSGIEGDALTMTIKVSVLLYGWYIGGVSCAPPGGCRDCRLKKQLQRNEMPVISTSTSETHGISPSTAGTEWYIIKAIKQRMNKTNAPQMTDVITAIPICRSSGKLGFNHTRKY